MDSIGAREGKGRGVAAILDLLLCPEEGRWKRTVWALEDDDLLRQLVDEEGTGKWEEKAVHFEQFRSGNSCSHRYRKLLLDDIAKAKVAKERKKKSKTSKKATSKAKDETSRDDPALTNALPFSRARSVRWWWRRSGSPKLCRTPTLARA